MYNTNKTNKSNKTNSKRKNNSKKTMKSRSLLHLGITLTQHFKPNLPPLLLARTFHI